METPVTQEAPGFHYRDWAQRRKRLTTLHGQEDYGLPITGVSCTCCAQQCCLGKSLWVGHPGNLVSGRGRQRAPAPSRSGKASAQLFLFRIMSVGWPPSRQLELSAEDGLECTCMAHGLSPGDSKQIQQNSRTPAGKWLRVLPGSWNCVHAGL